MARRLEFTDGARIELPIWRLLTWRGVIRPVAMMQTTNPVVICSNLCIYYSSQLLSKRKQDISPPTTKVATPYVILSTVSCQAVKNFPSPCGILSSDDERRAGLGYSKFGGVCIRFYKHLSSEFPGPKRVGQERSTSSNYTTHPGTSRKPGHITNSIGFDHKRRR